MNAAVNTEKGQLDQDAADAMALYGIVRVPVDYFHYKGYRYTSLKDAIAQAIRNAPPQHAPQGSDAEQ